MANACISTTAFWVLVGSIWVVGLLGIIISSISTPSNTILESDNEPALLMTQLYA